MEKNPLNLKEALQEELKARMSLALEAKMKEMEDEDDLDESNMDIKKAISLAPKGEFVGLFSRDDDVIPALMKYRSKMENDGYKMIGFIEPRGKVTMNRPSLREDKFSDFWSKVIDDLDSKFKKFDTSKIMDTNKAAKYIQQAIPKIPQSKAMAIAVEYSDYRAGDKSRQEAIQSIVDEMSSMTKK